MTDFTGKPAQFVTDVIKPVLIALGLDETDIRPATELLLGTALQESGLKFRTQIGGGPALGLFQMEGPTHDDIWENFLKFRKPLADKVREFNTNAQPSAADLVNNDRYAAAMARVDYFRMGQIVGETPIPAAGDIAAMGAYWKKFYNTAGGAGAAGEFETTWNDQNGGAAIAAAFA